MHDAPSASALAAKGPVDYQTIFDQRGDAYHRAMVEFPDARRREFAEIVQLMDIRPGHVLCDAPSGGGYLQSHLPFADCEMIALETSEAFHRACRARGTCHAILTELDCIELPDALVDRVVSLAGLHHLPDRAAFFREARRILKPGGSFCVADVRAHTRVARFLNVFVDRCNSMGHRGDFLDDGTASEIEAAGLAVVEQDYRRYPWTFRCVEDMSRCVTLLFGLDLARPGEVLEGIDEFLGYDVAADGSCRMNWGLLFIKALERR